MLAHIGKLIGVLAGVALGAVLGAGWVLPAVLGLLGLALGAAADASGTAPANDPREQEAAAPSPAAEVSTEAQRAFATCLAAVLVQIGRADGGLDESEVQAADRFFTERLGFGDELSHVVDEAFLAAHDDKRTLEETCAACRAELSEAEMPLLLEGLFEIASADGQIKSSESAAILSAARSLGIPEAQVAAVRKGYVQEATASYALLGLEPAASNDEIKHAFRKLAASAHPDRVAHLGPKAVERASQRFIELQQAYDAIRQERGI